MCEKIVDELAAVCLLCGLCQYCSVSILNFILQVRWLEGSSSIFHMGKMAKRKLRVAKNGNVPLCLHDSWKNVQFPHVQISKQFSDSRKYA